MIDGGFLGYETTLMLDVVVVSLVIVVPLLSLSLVLVHYYKSWALHKRLQIVLGGVLLVAVSLFEIDMRRIGGFWAIAKNKSPEMHVLLWVHLFFAITTVLLWAATLFLAWRRFPSPPQPAPHSRWHRRLGWLSALDITATSITGLLVYYYGFVFPVG